MTPKPNPFQIRDYRDTTPEEDIEHSSHKCGCCHALEVLAYNGADLFVCRMSEEEIPINNVCERRV